MVKRVLIAVALATFAFVGAVAAPSTAHDGQAATCPWIKCHQP